MAEADRHHELIARYLDGAASEAEVAELSRRVEADPRAAEALAWAGRLEGWLEQHFRQTASNGRARAVVERIEADLVPPASGAGAAPWARWLTAWAALAAVAVLAVGVLALWLWPRGAMCRVLSGRVLADGAETRTIARGATIRVAERAALRLSDGSRATLDPDTRATLHGATEGLRQLVALHEGGGVFRVEKAPGGFQVRTPVGSVTALGTEFSVRLLPPTPDGTGDDAMRLRHVALAVAVMAGAVQVQTGEHAYVLGIGDSQVFAGDGEREAPWVPDAPRVGEGERDGAPRLARVAGEITAVGGASIMVTTRGDRGEATLNIIIRTETRIRIETGETETVVGEGGREVRKPKFAEGAMADLKVGQRVNVTCVDGNKATEVIILRARAAREGEGEARVKRDGGEGEARIRREGGDGEGEVRVKREGGEGDREGEARVKREGGDGEGEARVKGEGDGDREGEARVKREGGEGDRAPKTLRGSGVLTNVTRDSITITQRGDRGVRSRTLKVNGDTRVRIEGGGDGEGARSEKVGLDSLRVGQNVTAVCTEEGVAVEIIIRRPAAPKREGEGERRREGEGKPPRPVGEGERRREG
ncbi:MAG TPA: FecR domain-containing protein [Planctomycetota bacterium]|nr:FecR domain-containing protein [Planctomycetota bacterium]HRR80872.1 FecR domain-containing protein [Planctomycetota bacterium]HRT94721.1 FecR domain-containing protein [Planctomycetota bacterium]